MIRHAAAWFLLFVVLSQWIGGVFCFQVSYYYQVKRHMNTLEQFIAKRLEDRTGIAGDVKMLNENALLPKGAFYKDFIFSEEVGGKTVYFELEDAVDLEKVTHKHEPVSTSGKAMLFKSLIQESIITAPSSNTYHPLFISSAKAEYTGNTTPRAPVRSVPTPPPDPLSC